jgi:hypothetical protein
MRVNAIFAAEDYPAIALRFYCAWYEIASALGVKEACLASCYSDDIGMPAMGIRFQRTQTIAAGADCCDFRFLRPLD